MVQPDRWFFAQARQAKLHNTLPEIFLEFHWETHANVARQTK